MSLRDLLNHGLRNFSDVTTDSDIFEHSLLRLLGYSKTPEKCQFEQLNEANLSISLRAPYGISNTQFVADLQKQLKDSPIILTEIKPNTATGNFIVKLIFPYNYISRERIQLFKSIKALLNNPENYAIYSYWSAYAKRDKEQTGSLDDTPFSMLSIESQIDYLSFSRPLPVWSAIVKELTKEDELELLSKQLYFDENGYQIKFFCKNGISNKTITIPLNEIVELVKNSGLSKFLTSFEFIGVLGAQQILMNKAGGRFRFNEEGNYAIDLGYQPELRETLEKFGISELRSYIPQGDVGERTRYYVYDQPNYFKFMLAIGEISGKNCLEERLHTLKYYCNNEKWDELKDQLNFLMEFNARTGVNIDYTELLFKLFDYAKENEIHGSFSILHNALVNLAENADNKKTREKAHNFLFETTLWEMTQLDKEGGTSEEKQELETKLFEHSLKAGLFGEAAKYLMVASGFKGTEESICSDLANPVHVSLLECGQQIYAQSEQLAAKDEEIAKLKKQLAEAQAQQHQQASSFSRGSAFFQSQRQQLVEEPQNPQKSVELSVTRK